ncbi:hypothetical protein DVJ83_17655 (plasmid) [Deinococcus wulumuqiensis]|uniref:Uncharacterized protein n=1 Tax=Deinococcus wulumuqiensis TaxID=980427 RepID=A0A345IMK8_9DEIO|nr:hypothetical protein [Deinococcus wulumuqiensis]AXH00931.1 hypothetical protein DVJ83_17655 [Deinococcus wulumuqiensis]
MKPLPIGSRVRISSVSGLTSNFTGTVTAPVPWRTVPGMYGPPRRDECCVRLDPGQQAAVFGSHVFMSERRLTPLEA